MEGWFGLHVCSSLLVHSMLLKQTFEVCESCSLNLRGISMQHYGLGFDVSDNDMLALLHVDFD